MIAAVLARSVQGLERMCYSLRLPSLPSPMRSAPAGRTRRSVCVLLSQLLQFLVHPPALIKQVRVVQHCELIAVTHGLPLTSAGHVTRLAHMVTSMPVYGKLANMSGKQAGAGGHFGRQMRKERVAHGWSLPELAQHTGYDAGHLSRVENGRRPPTEALAAACDGAFPDRRGWFTDWYQESRSWSEVPAGFRSWSELEDKAIRLCDWMPGTITGLLQSQDYARAILATFPAVTDDTIASRLTARVERQQRVLARDNPPKIMFLVDELALYRQVGAPDVMAAQMRHLAATTALSHVTVQVLPAIAHPANASGFVIADDAAWCEHVAGGYVFTDEQTVSALATRFDTLRGECYRVSESLTLIKRMAELWTAGVSPLTQTRTAASA